MSASEWIFAQWAMVHAYFTGLTPTLLFINIGLTGACAAAFWAASAFLQWGLGRLVRRVPGPDSTEQHGRIDRTLQLTRLMLRLAFAMTAIIVIARVWGLDLWTWVSQGSGLDILRTGLRAGLLLIIAVAAVEGAGFLINRLMDQVQARASEPRRAAQLGTLGPIIRNAVQTTIIVLIGVMMLSQIGIQVGPLIAGAGVMGLAIGFGAQTLVKDFITGFFLLIEDIVAVGDIVRIGDSGGQVEEMTLRTIRLRDFDGTLHVYPYSEAQVVHNLTKTFSYYVFDLLISYESSIEKALQIIKETGDRLQSDEAYSPSILEPIEVVGVDRLADSGVSLKARIKTLPIHQWKVGREFNRRIKLAFDAGGIDIPYPHVKVVMKGAFPDTRPAPVSPAT